MIWQIFSIGTVCYLSLLMGFMFTWPSSTLNLFASETNTTLARAMTETELALLGSLSSVGALITVPLFGYLLDKIGRRYCMVAAGIPFVISWSLIAGSKSVELVLTGMFVSGIGGAAFLVTPVFTSEIAQDSIRGTASASPVVFMGIGGLFSYICGGYLTYHTNVYIQLSLSVLYLVLISAVKESPMYFLQKGLEKEAMKALAFYRGLKIDSKEILDEICKMKSMFSTEDYGNNVNATKEEMERLDEKKSDLKVEYKTVPPWIFLWRSPSSKRALFVTLVLITSSIFMGLIVVQVYCEPLFLKVLPSMSSTMCTIIFAVVCNIASLVAAYLTDVAGRKALMIVSGLGSGVCTLVLGIQLQLDWAPPIATAVFIYMYCIAYCLGAAAIPYVLLAEMYLPEVKSFCSMIALEWAWFTNFIILLIFNPLVNALGLGAVFYIFSVVSFATAIFTYFYLPETKGLSVDVIHTLLMKKNIRK